MKFSKLSQFFLVSSIGLIVAALLTACQITTVAFVYVASSSGIETYAADAQSGALRIGGTTVTTGVNSPVALATTPDYQHLFVANAGNNSITHYSIGLHGELATKETVTLGGTPSSMAVDTAGTYLYVVTGPNPAELTAYKLSSGVIGSVASQQSIGLSAFASDVLVPTGVTVLANNNAVYVTAYDLSAYHPGGITTSSANPGWVFGFTVSSGGVLTAAANSPYQAGVKPSGIAADPTDRFVYVIDYASNQLIGYTILDGSTLRFLSNGPFKTGNQPSAITIDPRGKFIYVSNALDSSVTAYNIDLATGTPAAAVAVTGSNTNPADTQPVAIMVDPALGQFVYTANYLGNSVSGFMLNPTSGVLKPTQSTPYPTGEKPTALIGIPHGNHATQSVTP